MVGTVIHNSPYINDLTFRNGAVLHGLDYSLFNCGNEVGGNVSSNYLALEFESGTPRQGFKPDEYMTVLTPAACLLFMLVLTFSFFSDRFVVGDLRFEGFRIHSG